MPRTIELEWEFPEKLDFLFEPHRYKVAHGGRGGAKSWGYARALNIKGAQEKLRILCCREVQNSIKDSVHTLLADQIEAQGLGRQYQVLHNEIRGANGTEIIFAGLSKLTAESIKSYEGIDICWVEEGQTVRGRSWDLLVPTIRKPGSEIWISMNPDMDTDPTYERFVASPPASAKVVEINWRDNPWFPAVLEEERQEFLRQVTSGKRSQEDYDNIWEGKPRSSVTGAIFGRELFRAKQHGQIGRFPYDPSKLVYTAWDLGKTDSTAIWFFQQHAGDVNFIDYFEDNGEKLSYYLSVLAGKPYMGNYGTHYLPHDAKQDRLGMDKTLLGQVLENGFSAQIAPPSGRAVALNQQINLGRQLLARANIDEEHCRAGLEVLRHYRWGYNQTLEELKPTPVHDWASHGASAWMTAALSFEDESQHRNRQGSYSGSLGRAPVSRGTSNRQSRYSGGRRR